VLTAKSMFIVLLSFFSHRSCVALSLLTEVTQFRNHATRVVLWFFLLLRIGYHVVFGSAHANPRSCVVLFVLTNNSLSIMQHDICSGSSCSFVSATMSFLEAHMTAAQESMRAAPTTTATRRRKRRSEQQFAFIHRSHRAVL